MKNGPLARLLGNNRWELLATAFPVAADIAHWFAFDAINSWFLDRIRTPSLGSLAVMVGVYTAYCISLFKIRRLQPDIRVQPVELAVRDKRGRRKTVKITWPQLLFFYPSAGFGALMLLLTIDAGGLVSNAPPVGENGQLAIVSLMVLLFALHLGAVAADIQPHHPPGRPRYLATLVPTVIISELTLNLSAAAWLHYLGPAPGDPPPDAGTLLYMVPLFLLVFAAPRFSFMSRSFTWPGLISGVALAVHELLGMMQP